jgi:hypothetical protein
MTYTEDRAVFEAQLRQPPHFARMLDHARPFVGRLTKLDRHSLIEIAWDNLWAQRDCIHETNDILRLWIASLTGAARTRKTWLVWNGAYWTRVKGERLGKH